MRCVFLTWQSLKVWWVWGQLIQGQGLNIHRHHCSCWVFPVVKNLPANAGRAGECGFDPRVQKIPWRRKWQPAPAFLPGKSHGQGSLADCGPWDCKRVRHGLATEHALLLYPWQTSPPSTTIFFTWCPLILRLFLNLGLQEAISNQLELASHVKKWNLLFSDSSTFFPSE